MKNKTLVGLFKDLPDGKVAVYIELQDGTYSGRPIFTEIPKSVAQEIIPCHKDIRELLDRQEKMRFSDSGKMVGSIGDLPDGILGLDE